MTTENTDKGQAPAEADSQGHCAQGDGVVDIPMPQIPPHMVARIKRYKRHRFVMKWLEKLPWFKR